MRAHVKCRLSGSHERFSLGMGDLIGRSEQAALCIDDPRISEAHALVSLRGETLMLLALRGRFRVGGKVMSEVVLRSGMAIDLHKDFWLRCEEVVVPEALTGLMLPGLARMTLAHTSSLFLDLDAGAHVMRPGYAPDADVIFWPLGDAWSARVRGDAAIPFRAGDVLSVSGVEIQGVHVPLRDAAIPRTRQSERAPLGLRVDARSVRVDRGEDVVSITGIPGKILASVARCEHPPSWQDVVRLVWSDEACEVDALRHRFDVGLLRLREKLGLWGLPTDLIQMDGSGMVLLKLDPDDRLTFSS